MNNLERIRRALRITVAWMLIAAPYAAPIFMLSLLLTGPADSGWPVTYRNIGLIVYAALIIFTAALLLTFRYLFYGSVTETFGQFCRRCNDWDRLVFMAFVWPIAWLWLDYTYRRYDQCFALICADVLEYWRTGQRRITMLRFLIIIANPPSNEDPSA